MNLYSSTSSSPLSIGLLLPTVSAVTNRVAQSLQSWKHDKCTVTRYGKAGQCEYIGISKLTWIHLSRHFGISHSPVRGGVSDETLHKQVDTNPFQRFVHSQHSSKKACPMRAKSELPNLSHCASVEHSCRNPDILQRTSHASFAEAEGQPCALRCAYAPYAIFGQPVH